MIKGYREAAWAYDNDDRFDDDNNKKLTDYQRIINARKEYEIGEYNYDNYDNNDN